MQSHVAPAVRVFLVDDHDIVRRGLRDLLAVKRDITVVGDAASGHEALPRIVHLAPDVVVLDLHLQDGSGVTVARAIRAQAPDVHVLILTSAGDDEALTATVLAGAAGYATKLVESLDILDAIRQIGAGRHVLDPARLQTARERIRRDATSRGLANGQHETLDLLLAGLTDAEIARELAMTEEAATAEVTKLVARLQPGSLQ
jgi:two-component system response regulator DevR